MINWKIDGFLKAVLIIQFATYIVVFLNIPFLRQVFGFIYLSFIPGVLILRFLRLKEINFTESVLLSVGARAIQGYCLRLLLK